MGSGTNKGKLISSHEIACFAYCPEQWRLQEGLKLPPANQEEWRAGTRHHGRKAAVEAVAGSSIGLGWWLIALALAVLLGLRLLWR